MQPAQPSLVRRQIEQLQQSACGRLPPHLSGTPLRPCLTRSRTNLDAVWRSLENRDPAHPHGLAAAGLQRGSGLGPSRSVSHLLQEPASQAPLDRAPLRTIQGPPPGQRGAGRKITVKPDAVYQTIEPEGPEAPHYDKPVSPPVPVDPSNRKRKAERHERISRAAAAKAKETPADLAACKPSSLGPKPIVSYGHRTLPRKFGGLSLVDVDAQLQPALGRHKAALDVEHEPPPTASSAPASSTLPLKKDARGGQLWRRFSSFNPCSRWDDWSIAKKCDAKGPSAPAKSSLPDSRPPVPNRPLPPTPKPAPEKSGDTSIGNLLTSNLERHSWFHNVDRQQAEQLVKNGIDGYFLIRPSSQSQNPLTLTLWYSQRVYNISVRQRKDGRIALGFEKPDEQSFSTIEEMVINYHSENLLLFSRNERTGRTVLTKSPPK